MTDDKTPNMADLDLTPDQFPMTIEFIDGVGNVVHSVVAEGPGVMTIPPLSKTYGPVSTRITFGDGKVVSTPAPPPAEDR